MDSGKSTHKGTIIMFFLENDRVSQVFRCKKLFKDTFVKYVFQNFEPFHANRALKFQKVLI
jgi:hypothetical protein